MWAGWPGKRLTTEKEEGMGQGHDPAFPGDKVAL